MENIFFLIIQAIYLLLPGAFTNMIPPLVKKVNFLNYPMDFGKTWKGHRIFGAHKTWRGLFFGIVGSVIVITIQHFLYKHSDLFQKISVFDYSSSLFIVLGILMGTGVILGDAVESFFKRRKNIAPGKPWFPWDQLDALIGGLAFCLIIFIPPWEIIVILMVLVPLLHIGINRIGYLLKLQKNKF